jgi:hypothetical protein
MSGSSANRLAINAKNDYWRGIISAITTQGEITVNVQMESGEMLTRRNNMNRDISRIASYQGGDVMENLHVLPGELVFGWKTRQGRNKVPGNPSQIGFSSLNGIKWGNYSSNEELQSRIRFIGLAKTPYFVDNAAQLKSGFSAIAVGSGTTFNTGDDDIQPGDMIEWTVVPRPVNVGTRDKPRLQMPGGQFGDDGPGSRQGNPFHGTPHGKLRFRTEVSRFNDLKPSLNHAVTAMTKTKDVGGISDRPIEHLFHEGRLNSEDVKMNPNQEFALSLQIADFVTIVRGIRILNDQGIPLLVTNAAEELALCQRIGTFAGNGAAGSAETRAALIAGLYMGLPGGGAPSRMAFSAFRQEFSAPGVTGFTSKGALLNRDGDLASRYCSVSTQLGRLKEIGFARAVHSVSRRRLGIALCSSSKGERLDLLLGHFIESF